MDAFALNLNCLFTTFLAKMKGAAEETTSFALSAGSDNL